MYFILKIVTFAVAVFLVAALLPKVHLKSFGTAIVVALVYSIINFIAGWFITLISLPFILITFGLFKFVINAFLLWFTDMLIEDFKIETLGTTLLAAFLITIIDTLLRWAFLI